MDKKDILTISVGFGAVVLKFMFDYFLEKYKTRLSKYSYKTSIISLGATVNHDFLGRIEIYHEGVSKKFLNLATIEIRNNGTKEHTNFDVHVTVDQKSSILNFKAYHGGTGREINLTSEHEKRLNAATEALNKENELMAKDPNLLSSDKLENEVLYVSKNCVFSIPTITRGKEIVIQLLINNESGKWPRILPTIHYAGIDLVEDKRDAVTDLVKTTSFNLKTSLLGSVILLPGIYFIVKAYPGSDIPVAFVIVLTMFYREIAGWIIKFLAWIFRVFRV